MSGAVIGIDIGGTYFRIGTVEAEQVFDLRRLPIGQVFSTEDPLADLAHFLEDYLADKQARALAIGFPATLDAARQRVLQAPNVPFMEDLDVVEQLGRQLGIPVFIERDVTFALLQDCRDMAIGSDGIVCGFYFGTGIGNAIMFRGEPLVGCHGTAGELGHIPVDGSDVPCGCGNTGCMEPLAGGRYLAHLCETVFPHTHVSRIFTEHGADPRLKRFVDRMAMAVATEVNLLDPHHILIGGGVPAMADFPRAYLLERIGAYARKPLPARDLRIAFTRDREDKCILGAALYAREKLGAVPENHY